MESSFNDKLFLNTSLIFTDYRFEFNIEQQEFALKIFSGINDWNGKVDFTYIPNLRHNVKFGANYIYHIFTPEMQVVELEKLLSNQTKYLNNILTKLQCIFQMIMN